MGHWYDNTVVVVSVVRIVTPTLRPQFDIAKEPVWGQIGQVILRWLLRVEYVPIVLGSAVVLRKRIRVVMPEHDMDINISVNVIDSVVR